MAEPNWINDRYQILAKVGKGGSGTVYKAIDRKDSNERLVAVKLLGALPDRDRELQKEFFDREVRALSSLSHSRIIRLRESGYDEGNDVFFLILDYIDRAKSFRDLRATWTPDAHSFVDVMADLLEALSYAHQMYVIHRDLNPNNILFDETGVAHIIDFGVSKILGTLSSGKTVGEFFTRPYASPEQVAQRDIDYSTDQYSLAAVGLFFLSGSDPNSTVPLAEQFATISLPQSLRNVFQQMAASAPKSRFPSMHQALLALRLAKQTLEASSQHIVIVLTKSAIQNLYDQATITAVSNQQAKDIVAKALSGEVWVSRDESTSGIYDLIADSFSFRCRPDAQSSDTEYSRLVLLAVKNGFPPDRIERLRQRSKPIFATWHVLVQGEPMPANAMELAGWLDEIDEFFRNKSVEQKARERRADLIDSWRDLLSLDLELRQKSLLRVDYLSWSLTNDGAVIKAVLTQELNLDELIAPGQLLVMPGSRGRTVPVGHYVKQESGAIYIAKLRECNTDQISSAGKITADERQWMASWRRQKYALDTVLNARCVNPHLPDVLIDPDQIERGTEEAIAHFFINDLDEVKQKVISRALATEDIFLIQGPPGTGKTVVISEIVAQLLEDDPNCRILLVSQSNVAVDHVLKKVAELLPQARIARIGREDPTGSSPTEHLLDHKIAGWLSTVQTLSQEYITQHRAESPERHQLEVASQAITRILEDVDNGSESAFEMLDEKYRRDISELRTQFPEFEIDLNEQKLRRLQGHITQVQATLKGEIETALEDWHKRLLFLPDYENAYLSACSVVAGTCVGVAGRKSLPEHFDWAIVDEAGRATPSEILIPMVRAKHSILVGDHKQLPPVVEYQLALEAKKRGEIDVVWLEKSLFEFLFERLGADSKAVLQLQYRMHPHIANLIGKVFYPDELLTTSPATVKRWHGWEKWNTAVVWATTSLRSPERRNETEDVSSGKYNLPEVEIIFQQLLDLEKNLGNSKLKKRVAVIAGYSAQVEQLDRQIEVDNKKRWKSLKIEINTVDAFQGREEDIVFYSVVRSNRAKSIGFLNDSRRLNVALSRARELLVIVGDHKMVAAAETYPNANPFKAVVAHIISHPAECTLIGV